MERNDQEFASYDVDLNAAQTGEMNESFLMMFGEAVKMLMKSLFGGSSMPFSVKGTKSQVDAFGKTLAKEKKYMDNFYKYGLDNPKTYKSKVTLDKAVKGFESATKIKWPFA